MQISRNSNQFPGLQTNFPNFHPLGGEGLRKRQCKLVETLISFISWIAGGGSPEPWRSLLIAGGAVSGLVLLAIVLKFRRRRWNGARKESDGGFIRHSSL